MNDIAAPSAADLEKLFAKVCNWGRWGQDDERGTLNHLQPEHARAAAALVTSGRTLSLSRNFPTAPGPQNPWPAQHHMVIAGDDPCIPAAGGLEASTDYIGIAFHGLASSHLDALCHVFQGGRMYNGYPATDVKSTGARRNTVMTLKDGLAGRGVLLDAPRALDVSFVEPERPLGVADLDRIEAAQGVRVGEGDIVLIRLGRDVRRAKLDDGRLAGLRPEVTAWLHERKAAVLGGDGVHDPIPPGPTPGWPMPVHMIGLVAMGLPLLDNLDLDPVAEVCAAERRYAFLLTLAPLRIEGGTGSPLNPIALF
ncbi:MAG TPA: cyclase family protein [Caulobacteraceae bacterium]|nr:cyclase family protein [Caulobacteraceae bacterium]